MLLRSILSVAILSTGLLQYGCGNKDKAEDVNVTKLAWEDDNAILRKESSLKVKGSVDGNKPFTVTFSITDEDSKTEVPQSPQTLSVTHQSPPSGKTSLSLAGDMNTRVNAGSEVCNGNYTLNVIANAGGANVSKPLHFKVEGGRDCTKTKAQNPNSKPAQGIRHGVVYNTQASSEYKGAFDLVNGVNIANDSSNRDEDKKDLKDHSTIMAFNTKLGTGNGAKFAHTQNLYFDSATLEEAQRSFNNNAQRPETEALSSGDIYVVQLNDQRSNAFYILNIAEVRRNTPGKNDGRIVFNYRKL